MAKKGFKLDTKGLREFEKGVRDSIRQAPRERRKYILQAVTLVQREAVRNTKAGVLYSDGVYERGNLRRSLTFDVISPIKGRVFSGKGLKYPKFVEYGTSKMRPKPFLGPAVEAKKDDIKDLYSKYVQSLFKTIKG